MSQVTDERYAFASTLRVEDPGLENFLLKDCTAA
jgi:hypothetical protein